MPQLHRVQRRPLLRCGQPRACHRHSVKLPVGMALIVAALPHKVYSSFMPVAAVSVGSVGSIAEQIRLFSRNRSRSNSDLHPLRHLSVEGWLLVCVSRVDDVRAIGDPTEGDDGLFHRVSAVFTVLANLANCTVMNIVR
jgi:hypothetical protein